MKNKHKQRNRVQALVGMLMVFAVVLGTSTGVFAQVPPATSSIGNQATATYIDNGSNNQSVTSNTVVTTVQQVAGVTITAGVTKQVSVGGQVTFSHIITNTGNGSDSFAITAVDAGAGAFNFTNIKIYPDADKNGVADNFTEITVTPAIDRVGLNNTYGVVIVADIPATATDGQFEDITVTATSNHTNTESANATDKAIVDEDAVILVSKGVSQTTADVGNTLTYTINYSENGNASATGLVLKDPIPVGMTYVANSASWSGGGALTDASGANDPSGITFEHKTGGAQDTLIAVIANVANGSSGSLSFQVTVDAGQEGNTITNTVIFTHDDLTGDNPINGTPVVINHNYDIEIIDAKDVVIASAQQGATLNFVNRFKNTGSTTDTYNIAINTGNYPSGTQFFFYKADGNNNPTSTYQDTGSDGIPDTGPVAAGDTVIVILQVQLPSGQSGGPYSVDKTLTSVGDPSESDTHTDRVDLVSSPTVDLTNNAAAGVTGALGEGKGPETNALVTQTTNPGSLVSFTLFVKNTSPQQDNYDLAFAADTNGTGGLQNAGTLPTGWTITFRDPNAGNSIISQTGNLAAGASKQITAEVSVPAGYQPGAQAIYFRVLSSITNAVDIIHDEVTVNTEQNMQLSSNGSGQVAPGGSRNYIHTLKILSNVPENNLSNSDLEIELTNSKPVGWTATVYWDTNNSGTIDANDSLLTSAATPGSYNLPATVGTLNYNDEVKFIVKVTGLVGLGDGETNTTTITISDNLTNLASKSNTDLTEIQAGLLVVDKFQAQDVGGSAGTYSKNPFNVLPGDTVYYKLVVRNDGSQPVTSVSVTDDTPSFTKMLFVVSQTTTSGSGAVTPPNVTITSQPSVGAAGTIQVDIDELDSTEEVTITFAVKVDS